MIQGYDPLIFNQNFQLLIDIANNTEKIPNTHFDMSTYIEYFPPCGTIGCMIGHFAIKIDNKIEKTGNYYELVDHINEKLNLSCREWTFLFSNIQMFRVTGRPLSKTPDDPILAANRLRKYIYYKLHKREILGDCSTKEGRIKLEKARRTEGDFNFIKKAEFKPVLS